MRTPALLIALGHKLELRQPGLMVTFPIGQMVCGDLEEAEAATALVWENGLKSLSFYPQLLLVSCVYYYNHLLL